MSKVGEAQRHSDGRIEPHDPTWAYELGHFVKVLAERLQRDEEAVKAIHKAFDHLVWGMYQSNEIYVVARG
jgi:hypothetical protein